MPFRTTVLALLAGAVFTAVPCSAQNMKPGLWEINNTIKSSDGQLEQAMAMMQEHIAQMTPEQRKSMEAMMAKNGINMPTAGANGAMVVKMCMTREMVARNELPFRQEGNCTSTQSKVTGKTMKISFTCTQPQANGDLSQRFSLRHEDARDIEYDRQAGDHEHGCDRQVACSGLRQHQAHGGA